MSFCNDYKLNKYTVNHLIIAWLINSAMLGGQHINNTMMINICAVSVRQADSKTCEIEVTIVSDWKEPQCMCALLGTNVRVRHRVIRQEQLVTV